MTNNYLKESIELTKGECIMDFSKAGLKEGLIKAIKVMGYVIASSAVAGLIAELAKYEPSKEDLFAVVAVMIANAVLAFAKEWLTTHKVK